MERMNWATRKTPDKSTVVRTPVATWAPKRLESLTSIVGDQAPARLRKEIVNELWATRGDRQTLTGFIREIKAQEGLPDHS